MKKVNLGKTNLKISLQGFGAMGMSEFYGNTNDDESKKVLLKAIESGLNFIDTADIYGYGHNEELVGSIISKHPKRNEIVLATKCGIVRDKNDALVRGIDNSPEYIHKCLKESKSRLKTNIELYYLHRTIDEKPVIDKAMKAMSELLESNEIKAVGLSEVSESYIRYANDRLLHHSKGKHQISAIQTEYSLVTRDVEKNGIINCCNELGITFVAYSPIARGILTDAFNPKDLSKNDFRNTLPRFKEENMKHNMKFINSLKSIAKDKSCSVSQLALAWLINKSPSVISIPGTKREKYLLQNIASTNINITEQEKIKIDEICNNFEIKGLRYSKEAMKIYNID